MTSDTDPGVPEALPRTLQRVGRRFPAEQIDRLWIFPPLVRGRREQGLVAVSTYLPGEGGRRCLFTAAYAAERGGHGLALEVEFEEEGDAPAGTLPRVMEGVVRRSGDAAPGEPREVAVEGRSGGFAELLEEFHPDLLEHEEPGGEAATPAPSPSHTG